MAETLEANALLDLLRAIGPAAWRLGISPAHWEKAAEGKTIEQLVDALVVAGWQWLAAQEEARKEPPVAPP